MSQTPELRQLIVEHKQMTRRIADSVSLSPSLLEWHRVSGEMIALALANFKCEAPNCKSKDNLTIHHMIRNKNLMCVRSNKFYAQRNYFFNIAVLCFNCHSKVDREILNNTNAVKQTMEAKKLKDIRKKLKMETEDDKKMQELQTSKILPQN